MKRFFTISIVIILVLAAGLYLRPVPKVQATADTPQLGQGGQITVPWPGYGQAAFGAVGYGVLATNSNQKAVPIASIAKVVTALAVLHQKPLALNQQGPDITITQADVALYQKYVAEEGSVVPVNVGEQISEYQALQAMLLPSANNVADTLANWAYGSQSAYLTYANNFAAGLGLKETHLADASGFSPQSTSSAQNLVVLGEKLLADPVLAQIVGQSQAVIPVAGTVSNVNWLLGSEGVVGIKTGNTDQAGGCFLFAADRTIGGRQIEVVGALLGAPNRDQAISDSLPIIEAADNNFQLVQIAKAGQVLGKYSAKWGAGSEAIAQKDLSVISWKAEVPTDSVHLNKLAAPASANQNIGTLNVFTGQETQSMPIILKQTIAAPSVVWRIFHF